MMNRIGLSAVAALSVATATPAMAHPGHDTLGGLASGLMHPLSGPDHLSAILICGALAAVHVGKSSWGIPALFVLAMLAGGILGAQGSWSERAELALVLSIPGLGLLLVPRWRREFPIAAAVTIVAGLLHGAAHGAELPAGAGAVAYFAGFLISTTLLIGAGFSVCQTLARLHARQGRDSAR